MRYVAVFSVWTKFLTFQMACCTFVLLHILLAGKSYLTQLILSCCKLLLSC